MHRHSPGRSCCALLCALLICAQAHATPDQAATMTGDWGGVREDWSTRGVAPRGDYIGEAVDVIDNGDGASGARYAQQLRVGLDLAMDRLAGWRGGAFHLTLNDRRGRSASADLVGNRFALQQVYGGTYTRLSEVSFDYGFAGRGYLKLGFYAMGSHFGLLAAGNSFLNSALCAHRRLDLVGAADQHVGALDALVHLDDFGHGQLGLGGGAADGLGGHRRGGLARLVFRGEHAVALDFLVDLDGHGLGSWMRYCVEVGGHRRAPVGALRRCALAGARPGRCCGLLRFLGDFLDGFLHCFLCGRLLGGGFLGRRFLHCGFLDGLLDRNLLGGGLLYR